MKEVFIVVRPDVNNDFILEGVFSNYDAAIDCAKDPNAEYEGRVMAINFDNAKETYVSPYDEDE